MRKHRKLRYFYRRLRCFFVVRKEESAISRKQMVAIALGGAVAGIALIAAGLWSWTGY
jgi:hypothetical protein